MDDTVKMTFVVAGYFILGIALMTFCMLFAAATSENTELKGEAINRGYAEFVYKDNQFRFIWKNPPVEKPERLLLPR